MKVLINHSTRLDGEHLEAKQVYDIEEKHAKFLIRLGRATEHKEFFTEISVATVPSKEDLLKEILVNKDIEQTENREVELKEKTIKRTRKK